MTDRRGGCVVLAISLVALAACSHGSDAPAPSETASSASVQSAMPWAANAGDVSRFADEVPFGPEATARDKTPVRKSPGGEVVTTLPPGTGVVKLATHGDEVLVCFDDPKGGAHLMGWTLQSSLDDPTPPPPAEVDAGPPPPEPKPHGHHHGHRKQRH